jgi:hypothetical protein
MTCKILNNDTSLLDWLADAMFAKTAAQGTCHWGTSPAMDDLEISECMHLRRSTTLTSPAMADSEISECLHLRRSTTLIPSPDGQN